MPRADSPSSTQRASRKHDPAGLGSRTCHVCNRELSRKSDMSRHMKTHLPPEEQEKFAYGCIVPGCRYRSLQKSNADAHIASHTKNKELYKSCPDCEYSTADPGSLSRHRKRKHGYEPAQRFRPQQKFWNPQQVAESTRPDAPNYHGLDDVSPITGTTYSFIPRRSSSPGQTKDVTQASQAANPPRLRPGAENPFVSRGLAPNEAPQFHNATLPMLEFPSTIDCCHSPASSVEEFAIDGVGTISSTSTRKTRVPINRSMYSLSEADFSSVASTSTSRYHDQFEPWTVTSTHNAHSSETVNRHHPGCPKTGCCIHVESRPQLPSIHTLFAVSEKGAYDNNNHPSSSATLSSFRSQ
ncbi:hypothetical protein K435DRAFT_964864 [Dendrothele bispora CBS 962.96]|uniref:C2H2-type domain-containing protein n=1 Tax=Dendrothele bispora (strain CBS 962.96) TaxID=1314807 RepID=A0A4S8M9S1_DENBC|nr:hypothetical protein K435DRAFT_964864 [Dendrothele bispora CBS 962.96]